MTCPPGLQEAVDRLKADAERRQFMEHRQGSWCEVCNDTGMARVRDQYEPCPGHCRARRELRALVRGFRAEGYADADIFDILHLARRPRVLP